MAPFLPGDFITFSGFRRPSPSPPEVIAFSIVAQNVQILTPPSIIYIRTVLALLGIASPNPTSEVAASRFIGFVSNPLATVTLSAIDIDPCTGTTRDRMISSFGLRGGRNFQNKFEYRNEILAGYVREYRVDVEVEGRKVRAVTRNGILAGTYVQPVNVWVYAEGEVPGTAPVAHEFRSMGFLARGAGRDAEGRVWGALEPFPQEGGAGEWVCEEEEEQNGAATVTAVLTGSDGGEDAVAGEVTLEKRRIFGSRIALVKVQAVVDQDESARPDVVVVAPAEKAVIAEKEALEEAKILDDLSLEF